MQNTLDLSGLLSMVERAPSLSRLRAALEAPGARLTVGVSDAAKAVAIAAAVRDYAGPVVIVTSRADRAEALAEALTTWLGDQDRVLIFPERDALPYERIAPAPESTRDRLDAIAALADTSQRIIVASALALAQRTISAAEAGAARRTVRVGEKVDMEALLGELASLGYRMEPMVQEAGEASRRGGIIDVFSPEWQLPARIELMGREIESIRRFDPLTQRSVERVDELVIGPGQEQLVALGTGRALDNLDFSNCPVEVRERFEEESALLQEGLPFKGREFYSPFLASATLFDHAPAEALVIVDEESDVAAAIEEAAEQADATREELEERGEIPRGLPSPFESWQKLRATLEEVPRVLSLSRWASEDNASVLTLPFSAPVTYGGRLRTLVSEAAAGLSAGRRTVVISQQAQRLAELLAEEGVPVTVSVGVDAEPALLSLVQGSLDAGWRLVDGDAGLSVVTDTEIFGFAKQRRALPPRATNREAFLGELTEGAYVVHIDHGIARFAGLLRMAVDGNEKEYLELHYAEGDKLYVPTDQLDRVRRYIGPCDREPRVTRLASGEWQRAKQRTKRAVQVLARELLALYAAREALPGYAFPLDTPWQMELEASFPYVETPDQLAAIAAVKRDMESPRPMDRLVCGDVGYGKTEVAIRAAFKTVMDGKQVAFLVPTTVLAQQHYQTFSERLAAFPTRVEMLSRFRSDAEQREIVEGLAGGAIDIVVGTHRLLQKDVSFKNLGLVVIDEEQRFGVAHKERLKQMRREVDVLTLSATPIPRTLYMALGSLRDMSTMETPPEERLPIKTYVSEYDERLIRETIVREMERGGQVYFVHNRVHNIDMIARKVQDIVPEARLAIGHGQMDEKELARAMHDFVEGRTDVLVCTTIIESGLDIPNVNTIIMNQANLLGLGQLYQLRGRVGRGAHRAYAYLLYDRRARLTDAARQRLQTIFEATELGAGFQIALRDLEIRGAGNLLGAEQSGFMAAVGFDLYVNLLSGAVEHLRAFMRGETPPPEAVGPRVTLELPISAHLPSSYISDVNLRLALYQRLSGATSPDDVEAIAREMVDRFGEPPAVARNLLYLMALQALCAIALVHSITTEDGLAVVRMKEGETLPKETLGATLPKGAQAGRTSLQIELGDGWQDRLRVTIEQLAALKGA